MKVNNGPKKQATQANANASSPVVDDAPCSLNFNGLKNANAISTSEIQLNWDAATGNCNSVVYRIYDFANLSRAIGSTTETTYTADNLSMNKQYVFKVTAVGDEHEFSNKVTQAATTLSTNPQCALTFAGIQSATASGTNAVILSWAAATGCESYVPIYRVYQNGDFFSPLVETPNTSATVSNLTLGSMYSFVVRPVVNSTEYTNLDVIVNYGVRQTDCTGLPENGMWNTSSTVYQSWTGSAWTPSEAGNYNTTASTTLCHFTCNTNFTYYNDTCVEGTPPEAVTLYLEAVSSNQVTLAWFAPGDNGNSGTASTYDLRYSTSNITSSNFSSATQVSGLSTPSAPGTYQQYTITGLTTGLKHYFAMKTADGYDNWSDMSDVLSTNVNIGYVGQIGWGEDGWVVSKNRIMSPWGMAIDSSGNVLAADRDGNRVVKLSANGNFLGSIGGGKSGWQKSGFVNLGNDDAEFIQPHDVKTDSQDNIFVLDRYNNRIQKWSSDGTYVGWIGGGKSGWQTGTQPTGGSADRLFSGPYGLAIDNNDYIYVADYHNNRVQKWASNGTYIGWIGGGNNGWQTGTSSSGAGDKSFNQPMDVTVDSSGTIYVADRSNSRVQKWTSNGTYVGWIGGGSNGWQTGAAPANGDADAEFYYPYSLDLDKKGNIYVADFYNDRVQKWNVNGTYIGWIGNAVGGWQTGTAPANSEANCKFSTPRSVTVANDGTLFISDAYFRIHKWTSDGLCEGYLDSRNETVATSNTFLSYSPSLSTLKYFHNPRSVATDPQGNMYVADSSHHRVEKFDSDGDLVGWIGGGVDGWHTGSTSNATGDKYFRDPYDVYYHTDGNLYIVEYGNHRISKWTSSGTYVGWIGSGADGWQTGVASIGTGHKYFNNASGITMDADGNMYIAEYYGHRVQKWTSDGTCVGWIGNGNNNWQTGTGPSSGTGNAQFNRPTFLTLDNSGNILIADTYNHRIQKWNVNGTHIGWLGKDSNGWTTGSAPSGANGDGEFSSPNNVFVDSNNRIYVADGGNSKIQIFDSAGNFIGTLGQSTPGIMASGSGWTGGALNGFTYAPYYIWIDSSNFLYIVDRNMDRILKFK